MAENEDTDGITSSTELPIVAKPWADLNQPLIIMINPVEENHESKFLFLCEFFLLFLLIIPKAMFFIYLKLTQ